MRGRARRAVAPVSRFAYLGVLVFVLFGTAWLEVLLRTRVYARWRRLLLALAPVVVLFVVWDLYAIAAGHWTFDPARTTGVLLPGGLPLDEVLFFVVVPLASLLSMEAVRSVKGWAAGDEPPGAVVDGVRVRDDP
jgi:lycopene cyclase domain-containing protein